jgi:hypothetical protein
MKIWVRMFLLVLITLISLAGLGLAQGIPADLKEKLDKITRAAYESASAGFPCRVKSAGNPKMMRYQEVDSCLNGANDRVDWEELARQVKSLQQNERIPWMDLATALESSFAARSLHFDKVFKVKNAAALMPLSNSLLKFLPANSLQDLPVFAKTGVKVGSFSGVYSTERAGDLAAANTFQLFVFQFTDPKGNVQLPASANKLLLDRYAVAWQDAISQPGFRLTPEKLLPRSR